MAFKNLEQRFNESVDKLYAGAKTKFDGGKPSNGRNDDPLIVRGPGDGFWNFAESRSTPIVSTLNDVKRLTLFTLSTRGILFLTKQQLLQTGNTFEQTRLINPLFTVGNAVPFLHLRRNARPLTGPYGITKSKPSTKYEDLRKIGQLQKSTYDSFDAKGVGGFLKKLLSPITNTVSAFTAKKNVGEEFGYDEKGWVKTRPELGSSEDKYVNSKKLIKPPKIIFGGLDLGFIKSGGKFDQGGFVATSTFFGQVYGSINNSGKWDGKYRTYLSQTNDKKTWVHNAIKRRSMGPNTKNLLKENPEVLSKNTDANTLKLYKNNFKYESGKTAFELVDMGTDLYQEKTLEWHRDNTSKNITSKTVPYLKYFSADKESINKQDSLSLNARDRVLDANGNRKKISYIKDPSNNEALRNIQERQDVQEAYKKINVNFEDPINVSFAMGKDSHVKFRAYIKDLQQSVKPEYKSYQYIGRIEKFISYTTVQRSITFKLGIVAFSKDELEGVWRRINYLTGLAYPYGFNRGIMQPNIVRLSIGNVYVNQPGYIDSLNTNFSDLSETWDIDKEVPIAAQMDINFIIIEKSSKIADSPLYGITENMSGFSAEIPTAAPNLTAQQTAQTPVNNTIPADRNPPRTTGGQ